MDNYPEDHRAGTGSGGPRRSRSFLVRLWNEPRESEGESAEVRAYLRDLQTGDEHYLAAPGSLAELLERFVEEARRADEHSQAAGFRKRDPA